MGAEKDACSGMTSGNAEPRIRIGHDASTPGDTMRGDANEKGGKKSLPRPLLTTRESVARHDAE